ncbi:MAG: hypothetical protein WD534_11480 [Phycisphaeraceae bacterium]
MSENHKNLAGHLPSTEKGNLSGWMGMAREGLEAIRILAESETHKDDLGVYVRWAQNVVDALDLAMVHVAPYPDGIKDPVYIIVAGLKQELSMVAADELASSNDDGFQIFHYQSRFEDATDRFSDAILDMVNRIDGHDLRHGKPQSPLDARGTFEVGELAEMARAYMTKQASVTRQPNPDGWPTVKEAAVKLVESLEHTIELKTAIGRIHKARGKRADGNPRIRSRRNDDGIVELHPADVADYILAQKKAADDETADSWESRR